ncbi:MAG: hypothetical protein GXY33_15850 [Phycisphaerae bacterium]|nr:hypothetical protein [Phycisphaerae bacterium]
MTEHDYFAGQPLQIGCGTHLLLDDHIVEDRWRLARVLERPEKFIRNPILVRDKPWEGDLAYRPHVIYDQTVGKYRMWYQCISMMNYYGAAGPVYYIGYAESDDGFNWQKPLLDVCDFPGFKKTNIVYCGTHRQRVQGVQVWRDEAETDQARRYKMICLEARPLAGELQSGVNLAVSPDGLRWKLTGENHILDYHSDCENHVVYDPERKRWILYCRPIHMYGAGRKIAHRHMRRRVAAMTSDDFVHWSYPRTVMVPDERDTPDYDACLVFRYAGQFLMLYHAMEGDDRGANETRLAVSRDGLHWQRFWSRQPFLARGREGDWDGGQITVSCPPVPHGDHLLIYFTGTVAPQYDENMAGGMGVAMIRRDRFAAQEAGDQTGFLLTREFLLEGNRLRINCSRKEGGAADAYIKVELTEHPPLGGHFGAMPGIPGFRLENADPVTANRTDAPVTWRGNGDLSVLTGKAVYLRFEMKNMKIFAFQVTRE